MPDTVPEGAVVPPPLDSAWAESTRKKALLKLEKLDTDLKNYKGNSIKESIRYGGSASTGDGQRVRDRLGEPGPLPSVRPALDLCPGPYIYLLIATSPAFLPRRGHDDLGDHYLDCGDLSNALKCYSRARDYCTSAKHVINMCLNVIKVAPLSAPLENRSDEWP